MEITEKSEIKTFKTVNTGTAIYQNSRLTMT